MPAEFFPIDEIPLENLPVYASGFPSSALCIEAICAGDFPAFNQSTTRLYVALVSFSTVSGASELPRYFPATAFHVPGMYWNILFNSPDFPTEGFCRFGAPPFSAYAIAFVRVAATLSSCIAIIFIVQKLLEYNW